MLFQLFRKCPTKTFVIIVNYNKGVMREFLSAFADVKYQILDAGASVICSGVKQVLNLIPEKEPFMLIWSELILPDKLELPKEYEDGVIPQNDFVGFSQILS